MTNGLAKSHSTRSKNTPALGLLAQFLMHALMLWLCVTQTTACWAASGDSISLPLPGSTYPRTSGLQLRVDVHWVDGPGYRPLIVNITSLPAAKSDRYLTVRIVPSDMNSRFREGVEFVVKLPEGATSVRREMAVPQVSMWHQLKIQVFEDGRRLEDLCETVGLPRSGNPWMWTEAYPSMLFIDDDAPGLEQIRTKLMLRSTSYDLPDILALGQLIVPLDDQSMNTVTALLEDRKSAEGDVRSHDQLIRLTVNQLTKVALLPFVDLPEQWLNYTCLDLVFISLEDFRDLKRQRPKVAKAIHRYVAGGGNLIVYGVGEEFAQLQALDPLLRLPDAGELKPGSTAWQAPRAASRGRTLSDLASPSTVARSYSGGVMTYEDIADEDDEEYAARRRFASVSSSSPFRLRELGWGWVLAVAADDLTDVPELQWAWALNDLDANRFRWYRRNGISLQRPNRNFWDFLIPGVGAAPVAAFLTIITIFVIFIGPVNYFLLNRINRLYLLLVTVPLAAALIVGSLIGYAMVKDGLGTRARLRSFSRVMPDGQVVSWSRQSYYAGLAPSSGLVYPTESAVYPIDFDPQRHAKRLRLTRWHGSQQLAEGFLNARSTAQQLVIHVAPTQGPISLTRTVDAAPSATNRGSTIIDHLLIIDADEAFWIDDLRPSQTSTAEAVPLADAQRRYTDLLANHRPVTPPGFTAARDRSQNRLFSNYNMDRGIDPPNFGASLLEMAFRLPSVSKVPAGRVYYAVTTRAPEFVPVGVAGCRQEAGFHVIQGSW